MAKHRLSLVFWMSCVVVYVLPWATLGQGAIQFNGHDFAEWLSLLPSERQASPALLAVFSVRMYLVLALCAVAPFLHGNVRLALGILLGIGLLPPLEFLNNAQDSNYQQQAFVALLAVVLPLFVARLPATLKRYAPTGCIMLIGLGMAFLFWRSVLLVEGYQIVLAPSLGTLGVMLSILVGGWLGWQLQKQDSSSAVLS
jgi:hypothetical protein